MLNAIPKRSLDLFSVPGQGTTITSIDLDLTVGCNLRCSYCFKEKWNEHMQDSVAFDAIVWLIHASGANRSLTVNFMGGEPLLRFKLIKRLVPFAKRRASQHGKCIHFGVTTNGTLVTDDVVAFWKQWGMGFHTSIDGPPSIQDRNRPTVSGKESSRLVERSVTKILAYRPQTMARSTVVPNNAHRVAESYRYFRSLGYTHIGFVPANPNDWDETSIQQYENEFNRVGDYVIDDMRRGRFVSVKGIDDYVEGYVRGSRGKCTCGAGRGLVLIDIYGNIWPCHRWNTHDQSDWRIGSIYEGFQDSIRSELDQADQTALLQQDCSNCPARVFCNGGCPAENLQETGSVYRRHPNGCELTRVWARVGQRVHDSLCTEDNGSFLTHYYKKPRPTDLGGTTRVAPRSFTSAH